MKATAAPGKTTSTNNNDRSSCFLKPRRSVTLAKHTVVIMQQWIILEAPSIT